MSNYPPGMGPLPGDDEDRTGGFDTLDPGLYHAMLNQLTTADIEDMEEMVEEISKEDHLRKLYFKEFLLFIDGFMKWRGERP